MSAIAIQRKEEILDQVRQGFVLREIAATLGIRKQSIHEVLKDDPDYRAALPAQAQSMIDDAKERTWAARVQPDIAHAREVTKFAFRYAESVDPGRWAPRSHVTVDAMVMHVDATLGDSIRALIDQAGYTRAEQVIEDAEPVSTPVLPHSIPDGAMPSDLPNP